MKTKEIAEFLSAELVGDPDVTVTRIASLETAISGELSFSSTDSAFVTGASVVLVPLSFTDTFEGTLLKVGNPKLAFAKIAKQILKKIPRSGWHPMASLPSTGNIKAEFIGAHVSIGSHCWIDGGSQIYAGVRIGDKVHIGRSTIIHPNCVIYDGVVIGNHCIIQAGSVIGSAGFGYVKAENGDHVQFPQVGSVVIGDNVEIGANCTIDGGSLGTTNIGDETKIDNLVHIAHNVQIGKRVLIAGQSGIAGSSVIEDDVTIAGQVGISDHVTVRSGAIIGAKSSVFPHKVLPAGFWMGIPVEPIREYRKRIVRSRRATKED